jgi:redox-sensitive bicupin YhaK (pirin superfamily)
MDPFPRSELGCALQCPHDRRRSWQGPGPIILRVLNDDVVQPGTGFPTHPPPKEMEIITIVRDGEMTHPDSMGNKTVIKAGDV